MPLPLIAMGIGAAIGGGVGSYGHDNWGWSKDAIWQGAGIGTAGGAAMGGTAAGGAAVGSGTPSAIGASAAHSSAAPAAAGLFGTGVTGSQALGYGILGASALSAFAGGSSGGFAPQEKISLTKPGEELYQGLQDKTAEKKAQVESGDITNLARSYIPGMLKSEGTSNRAAQANLTGRLGSLSDTKKKTGGVQGGSTSKLALAKAGARVDALRAPGEWMGTNIKEQYSNVQGMQQNLMNLEQQAPMLTAQASLARESNKLMNRSSQGSAYANVARMGGMMTIMNKVS